MGETTLMFRHLPTELTKEEKKDLLLNFGATRVRVMGNSGGMKNTAYAVFPSLDHATEVLHQLHQVDVLGSKLVVEFSRRNSNTPSVVDGDTKTFDAKTKKQDGKDSEIGKNETERREIKFDAAFGIWGLKHPRRPECKYRYPPPSPAILTNIMNALAALPKFYVQVLHLMNKMDLPAPFGSVTAAPPLTFNQPDDLGQREMEISDSEETTESEMESDRETETHRSQNSKDFVEHARRRKTLKRTVPTKKPRLSEFQQLDFLSEVPSSSVPIQDVFEQMPDLTQGPRKIALKITGAQSGKGEHPYQEGEQLRQQQQKHQWQDLNSQIGFTHHIHLPPQKPTINSQNVATSSMLSSSSSSLQMTESASVVLTHNQQQHRHQQQHTLIHQPPPSIPSNSNAESDGYQPAGLSKDQKKDSTSHSQLYSPSMYENDDDGGGDDNDNDAFIKKTDKTSDGFGTIQAPKVQDNSDVAVKRKEGTSSEKEFGNRKFISSSALRRGRLTEQEMQESSVFRRYDPGDASCRLYIKNVARQATEADLHYIFGRYVDWDSETDVNMFDIRLMKEGRMKGQAFVTLPSQEVATDAVNDANGFVLKDKPLVVQFARSAKAQEDQAAVKS